MDIKPNPGCINSRCRTLQKAYQEQQASPAAQQQRQAAAAAAQQQESQPAAHAENEWGIEVVSEPDSAIKPEAEADVSSVAQQHQLASSSQLAYNHALPKGLQYSLPVRGVSDVQQDSLTW